MFSRRQIPKPDLPSLPFPYVTDSFPKKVINFLNASSETNTCQRRSYLHLSVLNAYRVASFLEGASVCVQHLKRDAGLRDFAQKLHLWPGDIASELQRDAIEVTELSDAYVRESLAAEVNYVERVATKEFEAPNDPSQHRLRKMERAYAGALKDLDTVRWELITMIQHPEVYEGIGENELHDLTPFIPGFTSNRVRSVKLKEAESAQERREGEDLLDTAYSGELKLVLPKEE